MDQTPMQRRLFLGVLAGGVAAAQHSDRPAPGAQSTGGPAGALRIRENFNAGWKFARQSNGGGALGSFDRDGKPGSTVEPRFAGASQPAYDDAGWTPVDLPHTWNAVDCCDPVAGYFRGIGWYRKRFPLDASWAGHRVFLEFEGVNQVSEFWVNGSRVGEHQGGYTSFEFDVTPYVHFGGTANVLAVKVDNLYNPNIAPTVKTDLTFYGGIYRDVWLRVSGPVYLADAYWLTPKVSESTAELEIRLNVINTTAAKQELRVVHEVIDADGAVACRAAAPVTVDAGAREAQKQAGMVVTAPRLWSPDAPNLYRIESSLFEGRRLLDRTSIPLGLRWFSFDADKGFFLNGRRLQLQGTTWHQMYPGMGNALPNSRHELDMRMIREMGCNFFRTSHYPHAPAVIEACDRLGMLVLEEMFVGEEVEDNGQYFAIQAKGCEEMVARDRNHPSVILWGFEGEVESAAKHVKVVRDLALKLRSLDTSRLVTMQDARVEEVKEVLDVVGLYSSFEQDDKDRREHPDRKYLIEEYTVCSIGRGIYGGGPESEEAGCSGHEEYLREVNRRPWIAGCALWHQFDYDGEEYDPVVPHLVSFGMADAWRIPKDVYFFYQSQWSAQPMLHICGHWTWPGQEGKRREVKVYSNAGEVELFLNGRSLGTKRNIDGDPLAHPPRLWEVAYAPGALKAVARLGGKALSDERRTAGKAARIELRSDVAKLRSGDRESLAYLTASVVDAAGAVVPHAFHPVSFTSYGPGELLPQTWTGYPTGLTWNVVAGMTRVAFRATNRVGRAVVSAYSPGLQMGRATLVVVAAGKRDEMEYRGGATVYQETEP